MKTYLRLNAVHRTELPTQFRDDDVRFSEEFVEYFVQHFTRLGNVVFDPFAGFGTTLVVAEALGRIPSGIELDQQRASYVRTRLRDASYLFHGDTRHLNTYALPPFDLSLTSPPYMNKDDPTDPFTAYTLPTQGYASYLASIRVIYAQMAQIMKPQAHAVIEVANLKSTRGITTLAWDIAASVAQVLKFEGEIVIAWKQTYGYGYDHSYALVFSKPPT